MLTNGTNDSLCFESELRVNDLNLLMRWCPCFGAESVEWEHSFIQIDEFHASWLCLGNSLVHVIKESTVVLVREVYLFLGSLEELIPYATQLVCSLDGGCRNLHLRESAMEHESSLLERKMSPLVESLLIQQVISVHFREFIAAGDLDCALPLERIQSLENEWLHMGWRDANKLRNRCIVEEWLTVESWFWRSKSKFEEIGDELVVLGVWDTGLTDGRHMESWLWVLLEKIVS